MSRPLHNEEDGRKGKMREEEEASGTAIDAGEIRNRCMGAVIACAVSVGKKTEEREKHFYSASGTLKIEIKIKQSLESEESGIN